MLETLLISQLSDTLRKQQAHSHTYFKVPPGVEQLWFLLSTLNFNSQLKQTKKETNKKQTRKQDRNKQTCLKIQIQNTFLAIFSALSTSFTTAKEHLLLKLGKKKKKVKKKSIKSCIFILELMRSKLKNHDRNVNGCGKLWFNLFFWICIPFC